MKKVYVAVPEARRREGLLELAGSYLKDAVMMTNTQEEEHTLTHLAENLKDIAVSDVVVVADGYTEDFDSKIEALCALNYDKRILLEYNNNLEEVT